jgi:hypothetical protein
MRCRDDVAKCGEILLIDRSSENLGEALVGSGGYNGCNLGVFNRTHV